MELGVSRDDRTPAIRRHIRKDEGPESVRRKRALRSRSPPQSRKSGFRRDRFKGEGRGKRVVE